MSKTYFTIAEQKTKVINFIKKHKNILCLDYGSKAIDAKFIGELVKTNNNEFFRLAQKVQLKFGRNFYIFTDNCDENHRMISIWLPYVLSKSASDKAIEKFCSRNSFDDVIATRCSWFNMTPKRWETFEAIFDFYDKPKTSKKTAKPTELKLSDSALLKDKIVFVDFEAKEFDHLMGMGGSDIDVFIDSKLECNAKNQIDNLINAFKLAKKEADTFIELLKNAKKHGAKHVVDSSFTKSTEFDFTK